MRRPDWLIHQLPVGMAEDEFLVRFLSIFQEIVNTVLHQVDTLPHVFDPSVAPDGMVRFMGRWLACNWVDSSLPDATQRDIVRRYSQLLQWRGTRRGLQQLLELISGEPAVVTDSGGVFLEDESTGAPPHVRLEVASTGWAHEDDLLDIVRAELPASLTFELVVAGRTVWPPVDDGRGGTAAPLQEVR
jgi:phage tail-like protein